MVSLRLCESVLTSVGHSKSVTFTGCNNIERTVLQKPIMENVRMNTIQSPHHLRKSAFICGLFLFRLASCPFAVGLSLISSITSVESRAGWTHRISPDAHSVLE